MDTTNNKLWQKSASELAAGIANRRFTATDVVKAHLGRIDEVNPELNAIVHRFDQQALATAAKVDAAIAAGEALGPLAGVPFTIKENIDYVESATTQGLPALAEAIPGTNSPIVDRMLDAGAIPIGRTNLPEMGLRLHTDNALHGATVNPWNSNKTTGGSSGGEGAALASGMSPFGLGNDIGGSLRNPATCCGIASIKPTQGVIPHALTIPMEDEPISFQLMLSDGPMARTVKDVRLGLNILKGYHPRDPNSISAELTQLDRPLKIALMAEPPGGETNPDVAEATRKAAQALADAGCVVTEAAPSCFEETVELWASLLMNDITMTYPLLEPLLSKDATTFVEDLRQDRPESTIEGYATALTQRANLGRQWASFFSDYDVLLSPTWTELPYQVGWDIAEPGNAVATMMQARCALPGNALGLPSACVPATEVDGLPVGVMLTGARFSDELCLKAAEIIEQAMPQCTPIDPR